MSCSCLRNTGGTTSCPKAMRRAHVPTAPNLAKTSAAGNAVNSPKAKIPKRTSTLTKSSTAARCSLSVAARLSESTGKGAKNSADVPAGTNADSLAAITAASRPSAAPTEHSQPAYSATVVTKASASASSEPWNRAAPCAGIMSRPGRVISTPDTTCSVADATASKALASRPSS